jgi:L-ribulokinase
VAGVDFGTLSIRVSLVDSEHGLIDSASAEYPRHRKHEDPEYATQSHDDHMGALTAATRETLKKTGIAGDQMQAIALDTTGSSVTPVGKDLRPLGELSGVRRRSAQREQLLSFVGYSASA